MNNRLWSILCFFITPVVMLLLFIRDPRAFIADYREFLQHLFTKKDLP